MTPESECSYASFETNVRQQDYTALVRAVIALFRPKRFTIVRMGKRWVVTSRKEGVPYARPFRCTLRFRLRLASLTPSEFMA